MKKSIKTGEEKKCPIGIPAGWQKWSYEECMDHNENVAFQPTHISILLRDSPFMVIDFDSKEDIPTYGHLFSDDWKSKSSARALPHLWRKKKDNDFSTCTTAIKINNMKTHIDLKYFNIFERIDSKIEYYTDDVPFFDFETYHPNAKTEKCKPTETKPPSNNYNLIMGDYATKRFMNHLQNCKEEFIENYSDWFKIGRAIKSIFGGIEETSSCLWFEILICWSRLSKKHSDDDYDEWETLFKGDSKCGIPTILKYSQDSNMLRYEAIEKEYYDARRTEADVERDLIRQEGFKRLFETITVFDKQQEVIKNEHPSYFDVKCEFELKYALIKNIAMYIEEKPEGIVYYNSSNFNTSHKMLKYWITEQGKMIEKCFITKWTSDSNMRQFDYCDIYPPPLDKTCPKNVYNLWRPFWITTLTGSYAKNEEALTMFKNHVDILCNHQTETTEYILKWIGQMLKCPAVKTICPTFISEEGAGKGTLLEIIRKMMGDKKVMETTTPSEHVWGSFNELMADSFLVNLNEMCKKEAEGAEGKIKGLITDNALYINKKGVSKYPVKSYHRFIITTNKEDPINTKKGDRRNLIIKSSDELTASVNSNIVKDYFVPFRRECLSTEGLRTIYDWLIGQDILDEFALIPMPQTVYQEEMKEASKSYYEKWIEEYVAANVNTKYNDDKLELTSVDALHLFHSFLETNHIKFDTNTVKIGLALSRMNLCGGITKKSKMNGAPFVFDMNILRKHFMVGVL
tara:strand:+ start:332 stop:2557 length:2226 start_codon:yes stop_codon:yes gene_type:complete